MRTFRAGALVSVAFWAALAIAGVATPAAAQVSGVLPSMPSAPETAADAALAMANQLDGAGGGISSTDLIAALEDAALAGQPMALF